MAKFYGWRIVGAAFVLAFFGWGLGFYGPPVYLHAVREARGFSLGDRIDRGHRALSRRRDCRRQRAGALPALRIAGRHHRRGDPAVRGRRRLGDRGRALATLRRDGGERRRLGRDGRLSR